MDAADLSGATAADQRLLDPLVRELWPLPDGIRRADVYRERPVVD